MLEMEQSKVLSKVNDIGLFNKVNKININTLNEISNLVEQKENLEKKHEDFFYQWDFSEFFLPCMIATLSIMSILLHYNLNTMQQLLLSIPFFIIIYLGSNLIEKIKNKNKTYSNAKNELNEINIIIKEKIEFLNKNGFFNSDDNGLTSEEKIINKKISDLKDEIIFSGIMKQYEYKKKQESKKIVFNFDQLVNMMLSYKLLKNEENTQIKYEL